MPNHFVARLKQIDAQLAALDKIVENGTFVAAGLDVAIHVGPARDRAPALQVEVSVGAEDFMVALRTSLLRSRALNLSMARGELRTMDAYLTPAAKTK